jgi:two-component system, chemotaxis family, chemotaxis protein CheY
LLLLTGVAPHVLIIDDDEELREAIADLLDHEGLVVETAANGREGLERLRVGPRPRLILLDLLMPVMNGWQFCEAKKADPALALIPVVALSAAAKKDPSSPYFLDVDDVIVKPVNNQELIGTVRRFVTPGHLMR